MTNAATGNPNVKALIYVAAFRRELPSSAVFVEPRGGMDPQTQCGRMGRAGAE